MRDEKKQPAKRSTVVNKKVIKATDEAQKKEEIIPEINVGDKLHHNKFGEGVVLSVEDDKFSVQFDMGTKLLSYLVFKNNIAKII